MSFSSPLRSLIRFLPVGLLVGLGAPWLSGCEDNISCVFTTGCVDGGTGGGLLGSSAVLPENGIWIRDARPTIDRLVPDQRIDLPRSTPIVIVFSETMNEESLEGAIEVIPDVGGFPGTPIPGIPQVLTGDGRVLVLLPPQLEEGDYSVQVSQDSAATDITGQELDSTVGFALANFSVVEASAGDDPRILTTYPADGAQNQSDTSAIVTVFDRPVAAASVTALSFVVAVDGMPPAEDPSAEPLQVGFMGAAAPDTRGYVWQSVDASGDLVSLGSDADVVLELSPMGGQSILDDDGDALANATVSFTTTPFASPVTARITSMPMDAIGLPNLDPAQDPLEIEVDLLDAESGDTLDAFLFGTALSGMPPPLVAFRRSVTVSGTGMQTVPFLLADLDIATSPTSPRFADGSVSFAFRLRRSGNLVSTLRVLDVDPLRPGIDDPELDTTAPQVSELFFPGGTTDAYVSNLRDIVIAGLANEALGRVDVTTPLGNNGSSSVVGASDSGAFVAAPVPLPGAGIIAGGSTTFTLSAFDAAGNGSPPIMGTYTQRGAVGPGSFTPGDPVNVEVFDALTLAPIQGALVTVHDDLGDGVNFPLSEAGMTMADGRVSLDSGLGGGGAVGALVTVDAVDYNLFTFHGITSTELSLPLTPSGAMAPSLVTGTLVSSDPVVNLFLPSLTSKIEDSRRLLQSPRMYEVRMCGGSPILCPYGPEPVSPSRLGVQSFLAGNFMLTQGGFNPIQLLQAFCLEIPLQPIPLGQVFPQDTSFQLPFMLNDPAIAPEEIPVELFQGTTVTLRADLSNEIDLGMLDGDPATTGDPRITVETLVPGVPGPIVVGLGLAYDQGGDTWTVRAAAPGAVTPGGFFGMTGAVDTDLFVRCELRDAAGRVAGARPRESRLGSLFTPNQPFVTDPSVLISPPELGSSGGTSYDVQFQDVIPDQYEMGQRKGLYRVELVDPDLRRWTVWTPDPPGSGTVSVRLPDIAAAGGAPLASGMITAQIATFAWPTLELAEFLWTDAEREHDLFSFSRPFVFNQP